MDYIVYVSTNFEFCLKCINSMDFSVHYVALNIPYPMVKALWDFILFQGNEMEILLSNQKERNKALYFLSTRMNKFLLFHVPKYLIGKELT